MKSASKPSNLCDRRNSHPSSDSSSYEGIRAISHGSRRLKRALNTPPDSPEKVLAAAGDNPARMPVASCNNSGFLSRGHDQQVHNVSGVRTGSLTQKTLLDSSSNSLQNDVI